MKKKMTTGIHNIANFTRRCFRDAYKVLPILQVLESLATFMQTS